MEDILDRLLETARKSRRTVPAGVFVLRGLWKTHYVLRLDQKSTIFNLNYVRAQTLGQGCSYFDIEEEPGLSESQIGKNVFDLDGEPRSIRIASLDAAFFSLKGQASQSHVLEGSNIEKGKERAQIVNNELHALLDRKSRKSGRKTKVLNVGVVGHFLHVLARDKRLDLCATDFYRGVVGQRVHGVLVEHGSKTTELVAGADVAIITGMTLANCTLGKIIEAAQESKTALILFAETGANFASEYCRLGIDVVVSEPFPFYLSCPGPTHIDIYRRKRH